ncbi:hypothetical protein MLD38_004726 [Melastoma candidum]|uniref:Uncharacterized protein n=1 Tax=Melastoma candidum TaxID=119954 RepID=A0ACB9SF67_9MYRT|nr:hypothetical protein MLD38_004726 [Melastoma candidum]
MAADDNNINGAAAAGNSNGRSPKVHRPTWNQILQPIPPAVDSPRSDSVAVMESNGSASPSRVSGGEDGGVENGGGRGAGGRGGFSGDAGKRLAWKKPVADGTVEGVDAVLMGAESWPALSGSIRVVKAPSTGTLKGSVDGSSSGQQADDIAVANSSSSLSSPSLPRSTKRSGAGPSSNGVSAMERPVSPRSSVDSRAINPSPRDSNLRNGALSNSHGGSEHVQQHRNPVRNRKGGTNAHGDGHHRSNFGTRRDHERGYQEWNHRNVNNNSRDSHVPQQRSLQRFVRSTAPPPPPPLSPASFVTPLPIGAFGYPYGFHDLPSQYYMYPVPSQPLFPHVNPHLMYQLSQDNTVHARILKQIDYYFSNENLVKDTFLRQNMDEQGWVPISLVARFNKVSELTDNVQIIMDSLYHSTVVEVQGDKIRRRIDWRRWIMPTVNPFPDSTTPQSSEIFNHDMVTTGIQSITLGGRETHNGASSSQINMQMNTDAPKRTPSGDSSMPGETGRPEMAGEQPGMNAGGTGH